MILTRRRVLTGLIAAPIVVRTAGLLMPVRPIDWGYDVVAHGMSTSTSGYSLVTTFYKAEGPPLFQPGEVIVMVNGLPTKFDPARLEPIGIYQGRHYGKIGFS